MSGLQPEARSATPAPAQDKAPPPRFGLWIILNLVTVMVCAAWPTGIPGLVFALLARSDWIGGDRAAALRKFKLAVRFGRVSLAWAGLLAVGLVTALVVASIQGDSSHLAPVSY